MSVRREVPYVNLVKQHAALKEELLEAVARVIDHGQFILGPEVALFEQAVAARVGVPHAVAVNSGTDALIMALRVLNIGPGDEVITASNSFVASASAIALVGATPVLVDVEEGYNLDPRQLAGALTSRTRAILPVHLTGRPAELGPLLDFATQHGLQVIEDCAQAIDAQYGGKAVGSFGTLGAFSLHPLKTLNACGDGGIITLHDAELDARLRVMRNIGLRSRECCEFWSGNSRLDTMQAAILLVKLKYLDHWTEKRRENARFYRDALRDLPQVQVPDEPAHMRCVYHTFVVQVERREALQAALQAAGIGTAIHYPNPVHVQPCAASLSLRPGQLPVTERQASRILSLPIYPELSVDDLSYVVEQMRHFYQAG